MRSAFLLTNGCRDTIQAARQIGEGQEDALGSEQPCGGLQSASGRHAGIQHVEPSRSKSGEAEYGLNGDRTRRVSRERRRARIFEECGVVMIRKRRSDDDVRCFDDTAREVIADDRIVAQFQMWPVFLRACAERNDDDGFGPQHRLRLRPGQVGEPQAARTLLRKYEVTWCDHANRKHREEQQDAHTVSPGWQFDRDCTLNPCLTGTPPSTIGYPTRSWPGVARLPRGSLRLTGSESSIWDAAPDAGRSRSRSCREFSSSGWTAPRPCSGRCGGRVRERMVFSRFTSAATVRRCLLRAPSMPCSVPLCSTGSPITINCFEASTMRSNLAAGWWRSAEAPEISTASMDGLVP